MKKQSNFLYFCVSFLFLFFVDFYFSNLITEKLAKGWDFSGPLFRVMYAENTGAAFSIMQDSINLLIVLSIIALLISFYFVIRNWDTMKMKDLLFIAFLDAGIAGNLYERIFLGYVRDFFDLAFVNFPIFNISDIFINIGVVGIIVLILLNKRPIKL